MTDDAHLLGQGKATPVSPNATLFHFMQESIMKASRSDALREKIFNSFSSLWLESKSFASLSTLTTNDVTFKLLAT